MIASPRVLIVSRLFPPEVSAGAFRLGALARSLHRHRAAVRVLTTTPPGHAPVARDAAGIDVRRWPVLRDTGGNVRGYIQYMSYDVPLFFRLLFTRFDLVVAESPPTTGLMAMVVAWLKRRPVVYYAADVWTDGVISMGAPKIVVSIMRFMERAVLRRSAAVISVSAEVTERLVLLEADESKITTVGNGIDTDVFTPEVTAASDERYFVYTGTMSEWQQPEIFIRAFAEISVDDPDVRLRFFGQGAVEGELRRVAEKLVPGRVEFGGVVSPAESATWIRGAVASLVSIVPGIGYDFAKPTKTYAAAAVGTPVLFAGPEAGAALVREAGLGKAVDFTADAIADGMRSLIAEAADGTTQRTRQPRAHWAHSNVSLNAVADRVTAAISQVLPPQASKLDRTSESTPDSTERPIS